MEYTLFFDGCCKGNPGLGGSGAVIFKDNIEIWSGTHKLPNKTTNNIAEYNGLLIGLNGALQLGITKLIVKGDSKLVISQLNGEYKVKSTNLIEIYNQIKQLEKQFEHIEYHHVYRKDNSRADALSNLALL